MTLTHSGRNQRGASLVVSLVLLLIMSLLGLTAMKTSMLEEKMQNNIRDKEMSFYASENSLKEGETWILNLTAEGTPQTSCTQPCLKAIDNSLHYETFNATWWNSNSAGYTGGSLANIETPTRHIIEYNRFIPDSLTIGNGPPTGIHYYRVTGKGTGTTDVSVTVIETSVARRF